MWEYTLNRQFWGELIQMYDFKFSVIIKMNTSMWLFCNNLLSLKKWMFIKSAINGESSYNFVLLESKKMIS